MGKLKHKRRYSLDEGMWLVWCVAEQFIIPYGDMVHSDDSVQRWKDTTCLECLKYRPTRKAR